MVLFAAGPTDFKDMMSVVSAVIAVVSAGIAVSALVLSLRNRKDDIKRQEKYQREARVWGILSGEAGLRSVVALDANDGETSERKKFLGRTAASLEAAGEQNLRGLLVAVIQHDWPMANDEARAARDTFFAAVTEKFGPPTT